MVTTPAVAVNGVHQEVHSMAQIMEEVRQDMRGIAQEVGRTELQRELADLRDDQSGSLLSVGIQTQ